jgi:AcrR family transcriptional regulator
MHAQRGSQRAPAPPAGAHRAAGVEDACTRRPGRPRSERAERAIIEAALDLLIRQGVAGLSMEAVAQQAGVAKTTVYRRWARKYDLIVDVVASLKGPVVQPPGESVRDDLVFLLTSARRNSTRPQFGPLMTALASAAGEHPELVDMFCKRIVAPRNAVIRDVLRRGVAEGLVSPDAALDLAVHILVSPLMVHSCLVPMSLGREQIERLVDTVLAGVAPGAAAPREAAGRGRRRAVAADR